MASQYMLPGQGFVHDIADGKQIMLPGVGFLHSATGIPLTGTLQAAHRTTLTAGQGVSFYLPDDPVLASIIPIGDGGRADWSQADVHWDFGDGAEATSGTWTHSGKPQDEDTGITTAHVYETAGNFTVTCTMKLSGTTYTYSQSITVTAADTTFSGTDIYFNPATGNDAWDGTSATFVGGTTGPKATIHSYRATYLALAAAKRINLVGGQTHVISSAWSRTGTATFPICWRSTPGTGRATISISGCAGGWIIGGTATENTFFQDIDATGGPTDAFTRPGKNWTFLRMTWTGFDSGSTTSTTHGNKQYVFFQEITINETESYNIYFNFGQRCGILGCSLNGVDAVSGEHNLRSYLTQSVVAHNRFQFPRTAKHAVKFVGYYPTGDPGRTGTEGTETVIHSCIHDNTCDEVRNGCDWVWDLGPVDAGKDQRSQDCFCYNNVLAMSNTVGDCIASVAIIVRNEDWTLYNNVIDLSQIPTCDGIRVARRGIEPVPTRCRALNTTVYCSVAFTGPAITITSGSVNCEAKNLFLVRLSGGTDVSDVGTGTVTATNITATSGLTAPGGVTGDYTQAAGSGGLATGTLLAQVQRYRGGTVRSAADAGADAQAAATVAPTVTTDVITDITTTTADCGGNVTSDGGAAVTTRGICWNTTGSPTTADTIAASGTGTGVFDADLSGLSASTTYYVRAYATNSVGTSYGVERSFTTNAAAGAYVPPTSSPSIPSANGMNLDRIDSGMTSIFHKDAIRQCSEALAVPHGWESTLTVGGATTGVDIAVDSATGYPLEVPYDNGTDPAQLCRTTVLNVAAGSYPSGDYTLKYSGDGDITLAGDASGAHTHNGVGEYSATVTIATPSSTGVTLTITRSNVSNPITGLRFILPGYASTYQASPYYPPMTSFLSRFPAALRFMDPMRTNGQFQLVNWSDRITQSYYTNGTSKGMCYEDMIALCNAANANLWVCVPHLASDDFVTKLFTLIFFGTVSGVATCTPLTSTLNVYVEYCNEAWNSGFTHYNQINNLGLALWPAQSAVNAGQRYYAKRSARIFRLAEDAATSTHNGRIIKILAGQASQVSVLTNILSHFGQTTLDGVEVNPDGVKVNAIAIAPYLGAATGGTGTNWGDTTFTNGYTTVAEVLALGEGAMMTSALARVATHKTLADTNAAALGFGGILDLIAYEAGANGVASVNQADATLNTLMNATLRDQGMYQLYRTYINGCRANGMKLMCHYSLFRAMSNANKYGVLESMDQSIYTAWRYRSWAGSPERGSSRTAAFLAAKVKAARLGRR